MAYIPNWALDDLQYNLGVITIQDCCGNLYVTDDDEKEIQFWEIIYDDANHNFDKLIANEMFGKKDYCLAQNLMDVHHLLLFLQMIQREREIAINVNGNDEGNEYYMLEYCTKQIREKFLCKGYSIQTILKVFQLFELDDPLGGGTSTETADGIGQMIIESETDPIFRVS